MGQTKLEVRNLQFSYADSQPVIRNMSIKITEGESVGIIGANGAGKSTLLMLILGILFSQKGEVLVEEVPVSKKTLTTIRKKVGMVFQNPDEQLFMTTVYDDVAFGPRNYKLDEKEVESRVLGALERMGILNLKERAPFKLSGGEKRSVAIAAVLSMQPDVVIMDEPTASLDPKSRRRLIGFLNSFEHTKIITSHDLDMVLETCERTIILKDGEVIADGKTKELLTNSVLLDDVGLEVPLSIQNCPICG